MFFALSEQLDLIKGIQISHDELRRTIVQHLRENPRLVNKYPITLLGCTHLQYTRIALAFARYIVLIPLKVKNNKALSTCIRNTGPHEAYLNLFRPST